MMAAVRILIWLAVRLVRRSRISNMAFSPWRMFVFGRVPRLHAADDGKATGSARRAEEGPLVELCRGMEPGTRRARPGHFRFGSAGLAQGEREQARAKQ